MNQKRTNMDIRKYKIKAKKMLHVKAQGIVFKGKFVVLNIYIGKWEMLEINKYLTLKIRERRQNEHKYTWEWKNKDQN